MDEEQQWAHIARARRELADLLAGLSPEQWQTPSLCAGWRVRDVAAHVAMTSRPPRLGASVTALVRARGSFNRLNHDLAVEYGATPEELVAQLRSRAASRRLPVVTNVHNLLPDVLVHSQDIAVPLGLELDQPGEALRTAADRIWSMGWPFRAQRRLRGVRLRATDHEWAAGSGAELSGPLSSLLLVMTGRDPGRVAGLAGPGRALLPGGAPSGEGPGGATAGG